MNHTNLTKKKYQSVGNSDQLERGGAREKTLTPDLETNKLVKLVNRDDKNLLGRLRAFFRPANSGTKSRILVYAWFVAIILVSVLLMAIQTESTHFFGIVEGKQQAISFQHPVDIVKINVVEGQEVERGESLLQVRRNDLSSSIAILDDKISEIQLANSEFLATTKAKVKMLKAQQRAKYNELSTAINRLETRHKLNTKLQSKANSKVVDRISPNNILVSEMKDLKASRWHTNNSFQAQIDNLTEQLELDERPANAQLAELDKRKFELLRQQSELNVSALFLGSVGSILYKPGETVEPFKPIVTLHSANPNIVKGYIHESILNNIEIGQTVWVKSLSAKVKSRVYEGIVQSLGSRMIEYPIRLRRDKNVLSFGREVVVRVKDESRFLLSEKVIVSLAKPQSFLEIRAIDEATDFIKRLVGLPTVKVLQNLLVERNINQSALTSIKSKSPLISSVSFEASGIIPSKRENHYLVISDELVAGKPIIALMNRLGELTSALDLIGGPEIDDLESISYFKDSVYLMSSLSYSKRKKLKQKRRLLFQVVEKSESLEVVQHIDIYDKLVKFSTLERVNQKTKKLLSNRINNRDLEIESHFVDNNSLFIGLKSPRKDNSRIIILKISEIDSFMQGRLTNISIWKELDPYFNDGSKSGDLKAEKWFLTDMALRGNELYLLTVDRSNENTKGQQKSAVWQFDTLSNTPSKRLVFEHRAAEGLLIDNAKNELIVVFDEGGEGNSKFFKTNLLPQRNIKTDVSL
ncbi:MAG: hypothetical protein ABJI60_14335 [Kangiellaceae bacterium]